MVPVLAGEWWRPFTQLDGIHVVHVDLAPHEVNERSARAWLNAEEQRRARRIQHAGARRRYVLCRASLRSLLCGAVGCGNKHLAFEASKHGKPVAIIDGQPAPINFNVSHSGYHGLIALAPGGQVGVDVEERIPHPRLDELIAAVFGPNEQRELAATQGQGRLHLFFSLWTMKEALSKSHGMGLSLDVARFEIPKAMREGSASGCFRFADLGDVTWRLHNIGTDRFAAAVAHSGDQQ